MAITSDRSAAETIHRARRALSKLHEDDDADDVERFWFVLVRDDGSSGCFMGEIYREEGSWRERPVQGKAPYGFGGKTYMSYLEPRQVISYISGDYSRTHDVKGPFFKRGQAEQLFDSHCGGDEDGGEDLDPAELAEDADIDNSAELQSVEDKDEIAQIAQIVKATGCQYKGWFRIKGDEVRHHEMFKGSIELSVFCSQRNLGNLGRYALKAHDRQNGREVTQRIRDNMDANAGAQLAATLMRVIRAS